MLPNAIRMIIIGPSGGGKTQLLLTMIMKYMTWEKLYLVAPSLDDQHCYQVLKDYDETVSEAYGGSVIEFITYIDDAPSVEDLDVCVNNLVVYDDVMLNQQKNPARIFSRDLDAFVKAMQAAQKKKDHEREEDKEIKETKSSKPDEKDDRDEEEEMEH